MLIFYRGAKSERRRIRGTLTAEARVGEYDEEGIQSLLG